jgi:hypothetical protein
MKKTIFYAGMAALMILGIFIDAQRITLRQYSASTYDLFPAAWFDVFSSIVFIGLIAALANLSFQYLPPLFASIFFTLAGIFFLGLFLLYLMGLSFPPGFELLISPASVYTRLSGADWFYVGALNIVKYFKRRVVV